MGAGRSERLDASARAADRAPDSGGSAKRGATQNLRRDSGRSRNKTFAGKLIECAEAAAPFAAGATLFACGVCASGAELGLKLPAGPMAGAGLVAPILVGVSGAGILVAAVDRVILRR